MMIDMTTEMIQRALPSLREKLFNANLMLGEQIQERDRLADAISKFEKALQEACNIHD